MSEYINREDALKLRDVFSDRQNGNKHFFSGIESACEFLEALPTDSQRCGVGSGMQNSSMRIFNMLTVLFAESVRNI